MPTVIVLIAVGIAQLGEPPAALSRRSEKGRKGHLELRL
jgi:hypothetical protein